MCKGLVHLHGTLYEYFEHEAMDTDNRKAIQTKCRDLKECFLNPKLLLYVFFLQAYLSFLSEINVLCQCRNGFIFESCSKIQNVIATLIEPVVVDSKLLPEEIFLDSNIKDVGPDTMEMPLDIWARNLKCTGSRFKIIVIWQY